MDPSQIFKIDIQPSNKKGFTLLNPSTVTSDRHNTFMNKVECSPCNNIGYISTDPRLFSAMRGSYMILDKPPLDSSIKFSELYGRQLRDFGKNYGSYQDINAGQYIYYINHATADAYIKPVFQNPALVVGYDYVDPMSTIKPHYKRYPITEHNFIREVPKSDDCCNKTGYKSKNLSSIVDSQYFREDLIASQMAIPNQRKYSARCF